MLNLDEAAAVYEEGYLLAKHPNRAIDPDRVNDWRFRLGWNDAMTSLYGDAPSVNDARYRVRVHSSYHD